MGPATLSGTLPKSNHHRASALALGGNPRSAALLSSHPASGGDDPNGEHDHQLSNSGFTHPDHVIPSPTFNGIVNLVIVCCHAIFHPSPTLANFPLHSPQEESNWHLAPFQKSVPQTGKPGEHETFLAHIWAGIDTVTSGPWAGNSLLVFSGGATKQDLTDVSEARSYYHAALAQTLAQNHKYSGLVQTLFKRNRLLLEEHATDSFQNLLFSILLFKKTTGIYPTQIRIVTHAFKSKRFLELHAPAIGWPLDRIRVCGIDPVMSAREYEDTVKGEEKYGYTPWVEDPLGTGEVLDRKRRQRGWDEDTVDRLIQDVEDVSVRTLLTGSHVNILPWSNAAASASSSQ